MRRACIAAGTERHPEGPSSHRVRPIDDRPHLAAGRLTRSSVEETYVTVAFKPGRQPRTKPDAMLSYLAVLEGPAVVDSTLALFTAQRAER
jgi:hypothetical protein